MILQLDKMQVADGDEVQYFMHYNNKAIAIHDLVGQPVSIRFGGKITCMNCDRTIKKTYQGYCYDCFNSIPEAAPCIIHPELCEAHLGKGRDVEWEEKHHNQPHIVYLSLSSDVKVGVTRDTQIPTRWIDQGAVQGLIFAEVPYRQLAGIIEVELKQFISDKTDWRKMLRNDVPDIDLQEQKQKLAELLSPGLEKYVTKSDVRHFNYPVIEYPKKITGLRLDNHHEIEEQLRGIKGQYLIFGKGKVFNVRNHRGYHVQIEV